MASLSRELSILMSPVYGGGWAAQQIEPLIPKQGDTIGTVMFKMARIAQSADNALEAVSKAQFLSNDEKKYASDMRGQIGRAIPWSTQQAQAFAQKGQAKESFGAFVKRGGMQQKGGAEQPGVVIQSGWRYDAKTHQPLGPAQ
jgi:hypothetical protein